MERKQLKAAIIGMGRLGQADARFYTQYEGTELVIVCDIVPEVAKANGEKWRCQYTTDYSDIAASDVDIVSVVTPDFAHYQSAMAMLQAGKHVLCQKPLTTNLTEAKALVARAKERGVKLGVNTGMRLYPAKFHVKQVLDTGRLGHIVSAYSNTANALNIPLEMLQTWSSRSGPQWFKLPHTVDTLRFLLGKQEAVEVYARGAKGVLREMGIDAYDSIHAVVTYESGTWVTYDTAWIQPNAWDEDNDTYFVLTCSKGMAKATATEVVIADRDSHLQLRGKLTRYLPPDFAKARLNLNSAIGRFVRAVENDTEPWVTGEDGLAVVATIRAMEKSIETGKPVKMAELMASA